jgi:hypothetical protein
VSFNKTFSVWAEIFGDPVAVAAMVDRLVHRAEVIVLKGRQLSAQRQAGGDAERRVAEGAQLSAGGSAQISTGIASRAPVSSPTFWSEDALARPAGSLAALDVTASLARNGSG